MRLVFQEDVVVSLTSLFKSTFMAVQFPVYTKLADPASNYCDATQMISIIVLSLTSHYYVDR